MLFLKNLYIILTIIIALCISSGVVLSFRKKNRETTSIRKLEVTTILAMLTCFLFYWIKNYTIAYILWSVYIGLLDIDLFYILLFVFAITDEKTTKKKSIKLRVVYSIFVLFDICLMIFNRKTGRVFSIQLVTIDDVFTTWTVKFNSLFHIHLIFCYIIVLTTSFVLMKHIVKVSRFARRTYITILTIFLISVFVNGIFIMIPQQVVFDFSTIVYGCLLTYVYYYTMYSVPMYLSKNIITNTSENITDAIICFDDREKFVYANKIARTFFSNQPHEIAWAKTYMQSENDFLIRTEKVEIDGVMRTFKVEFRRIRDQKQRNSGCYLKLNDCTDEVLSMERESYRATHDELTGLYNRDFFFREMARILRNEPDVPRYLVCSDILNFKLVNELFGSKFGDRLLVRQAEMLKRANYPGVIHGRISGDRYAMLIPKENFRPDLAEHNTDQIIELEKEINFKLTVYIGIYEITDPTENVHTMYDKASMAIKNVEPGYNKALIYYDTELMNKLILEKTIVSEFDDALNSNQFEMYLQPQIDVKTGKCLGGEALVRWNHPEKGYISPAGFIKALEKSDQIYKLDYYIWEQAAKKLSEWQNKGIDYYISVNISVKDFYYGNLVEYFRMLVEKYNILPSRLNLEITESVVINDNKNHRKILSQLRDYGFLIEMDDFGSGYSSLNVLKDINMDVLKIDMGFLRHTENEDRANTIVTSIVKMAKGLEMEVVSEGVETQQQADFLAGIGVDIYQGYLYSKPICVKEFEQKYLSGEL